MEYNNIFVFKFFVGDCFKEHSLDIQFLSNVSMSF